MGNTPAGWSSSWPKPTLNGEHCVLQNVESTVVPDRGASVPASVLLITVAYTSSCSRDRGGSGAAATSGGGMSISGGAGCSDGMAPALRSSHCAPAPLLTLGLSILDCNSTLRCGKLPLMAPQLATVTSTPPGSSSLRSDCKT